MRLRTRWTRALAVLLLVFALGGTANFVGTRSTVGAFRNAAERMERDAEALAALRGDIVAVAFLRSAAVQTGQVDEAAFGAALAAETASFRRAIRVLRPGGGSEVVARHFALSQALWAGDVATLTPQEFVAKSSEGRVNFAMIEEAAAASRAQARDDLSAAARLDRNMTVATLAAGLLAIAFVIRFARRLSREVLRPVARLRDSAGRLAAGDLDHRVEVERADEIGDLAATFNAMAEVVAGSHRSLTLQANQDALTGLANRAAFHSRLQSELSRPERRDGTQAVLFIDLDDFKDVNDELGHAAGDTVLCAVATRLADAVRPGDLAARLGGDEFAVLLDGLPDPAVALDIAERALAALAAPVEVSGTWVHVGASAGLAMRHEDSDLDGLLREADVAMYSVKARGKHRVERYDATLHESGAGGGSGAAARPGLASL
ncbi:MAG: diguanylate cyclase domain-containing protein [Actinomycetota bacterium]